MSVDIVKFAFVGGEVSPSYYGRSDLEKFDLALAEAENWFVDYHGGLSNSPGLEFVDYVKNDNFPTKFFAFRFSSSIANTNVILFGKDYIRFIQDGAYVLEAELSIASISAASPGVVETTNPHAYATGDWVKFPSVGEMTQLAGRTCSITVLSVTTFSLQDVFGNDLDTSAFTTYVSDGTVSRIYTLVSPYSSYDLTNLRSSQIRDVIRLTHNNYPVYNLVRNDSADWEIELEDFTHTLEVPIITSGTTLNGGSLSVGFVITQVNQEGVESSGSDYHFQTNVVKYDDVDGGVLLVWPPIVGAAYYKIYRTRIIRDTTAISRSYQVGYIGQSKGGHFVDNGITPDFAQTPPTRNNPFANGAITSVDVMNGGSGYTNSSALTAVDPNPSAAGFIGYAIIQTSTTSSAGPVVGIFVVDGGHDYTNPSFSLTGGSGVVLSANIGPTTGNYPAVSSVYQQRQVYAATKNKPLTLFGTKPGQLSNMATSEILIANDAYEHEVDSEDVSPIRNLTSVRGGLIVQNAATTWLASGSNGIISATNVQIDPQSSGGSTEVPTLKVESDVLYLEGAGGRVTQIAYNDVAKIYQGTDLSLLANHLISPDRQIENWCYASEPHKLIWAQRSDGVMLNMTIIKEQQVYAFSRRVTRGKFIDVISLEEDRNSTVYTMVERYINGRYTKFIEKVSSRTFTHVEDAFFVDCGLRLGTTWPDARIQIAATEGDGVQVDAESPIFAAGDVGKILRFGGGKMRVATYSNAYSITVNIVRDITETVPFSNPVQVKRAESGQWSLDAEVTTIRGLEHLEGEAVSVLADGNVVKGLTVIGGSITLPQAASRVAVGLKYRSLAKNLPLNVDGMTLENKRQRVTGIAMRLNNTRGLTGGNSLSTLYALKLRTGEDYGEATELKSGMTTLLVEPIWDNEVTSYLVQDDPLPATVLGYVLETELGDDTK